MSRPLIEVLREKLGNLMRYAEELAAKYDIDLSVPEEARKKMIEENISSGIPADQFDPTAPGYVPRSMIELAKWLVNEMEDSDLLLYMLKITSYSKTPGTVILYFADFLHCKNGEKVVFDAADMLKLTRYVSLFCDLLA